MALPIDPGDPGDGGGGTGGGGGTTDPSYSVGTVIFDLNFTKQEASSVIKVIVYANVASPDDIQFIGYVFVDGQVMQTSSANIILDNSYSQGRMTVTPFAYVPGLAAGQHNVKFTVRNVETDNVALSIYAGATMEVLELKQGAR